MVKLSFKVLKKHEKGFPLFLPQAKRKRKEKNKRKALYGSKLLLVLKRCAILSKKIGLLMACA